MKEEQKAKRKRRPAIRLLIGSLYFHYNQPVSYCFRRWLFDMVRPDNLSVLMYSGMVEQGYCSIADPDRDFECWGSVNVNTTCFGFSCDEKKIAATSQKTSSNISHQST